MTISHDNTIAFIGAGNMATCLINGLIAHDYPAHHIVASDPHPEKQEFLQQEFNIHCYPNNKEAVEKANIIILAVKPDKIQSVLSELKEQILHKKPLIISIAAGVTLKKIQQALDNKPLAIVRCMPNIAAFVQSGATTMIANQHVSPLQRDLAENILRSVGLTLWVNTEHLIDVTTAVSGSGPAYFFLFMEAMESSAVNMGLSQEEARLLIAQTALGAAKFVLSTDESIESLRARVTSKGGTTEQAIMVFEKHHLRECVGEAMKAAYQKSIELSEKH